MGSSKPHTGEIWTRLASGIEAGIVGGLAMLGLLVSQSLWEGHVWWEVPNLLGSTFYGPRAFRSGVGLATLSGTALHLVITGTLGGVFGLIFGRVHQRGKLIFLGLLASLGWYNLADVMFWPKVNPWVPAASSRPATVVSHLLLGACLGYMGRRQKAVAPAPGETISPLALDLASPAEPPEMLEAGVLAIEAAEPEVVKHLVSEDQHLVLDRTPAADRRDPPAAPSPDAIE
jgi:hypothetical protein